MSDSVPMNFICDIMVSEVSQFGVKERGEGKNKHNSSHRTKHDIHIRVSKRLRHTLVFSGGAAETTSAYFCHFRWCTVNHIGLLFCLFWWCTGNLIGLLLSFPEMPRNHIGLLLSLPEMHQKQHRLTFIFSGSAPENTPAYFCLFRKCTGNDKSKPRWFPPRMVVMTRYYLATFVRLM